MLAAQDQGITTSFTFDRSTDPKYRFGCYDNESPSTSLSQCETLKKEDEYTTRQYKLCSNIQWNILGSFKIDRLEKYWEHKPQNFIRTEEVDIYYDKPVKLGAYINNKANRPDIIIYNRTTKQVQIVEVGITNDIGITNTIHRKIIKYADFINIMKREWRLEKVEFIPVVIGTTGLYRKNLIREIDKIWGNVDINQLQIEVIKSGVTILKRALSMKV